jgi:hypothetical protein
VTYDEAANWTAVNPSLTAEWKPDPQWPTMSEKPRSSTAWIGSVVGDDGFQIDCTCDKCSQRQDGYVRRLVAYDRNNREWLTPKPMHFEFKVSPQAMTTIDIDRIFGINRNPTNKEKTEMFKTATARTKSGHVGQVLLASSNDILWESEPIVGDVTRTDSDGDTYTVSPESQAIEAAQAKIKSAAESLFA